jgi:membrane protein DedA with SNARE-associated domain
LIAATVFAAASQMNIAVVFLVAVPAGIAGMHWLKFLGYNALGAVLWVGTWCGLEYLAGENIVEIYDTFERHKWYVIGALAVVIAIVITRRVRHSRSRGRAERTA